MGRRDPVARWWCWMVMYALLALNAGLNIAALVQECR